jgi:hypothetical protein
MGSSSSPPTKSIFSKKRVCVLVCVREERKEAPIM